MLQTIPAELILDAKAALGEGPIWDVRKQALYWVDIAGCALHIFDPATGTDRALDVGQPVGTVVPRRAGGVRQDYRGQWHRLEPGRPHHVLH